MLLVLHKRSMCSLWWREQSSQFTINLRSPDLRGSCEKPISVSTYSAVSERLVRRLGDKNTEDTFSVLAEGAPDMFLELTGEMCQLSLISNAHRMSEAKHKHQLPEGGLL